MRFLPENDPQPPKGKGIQLCYRALPHYEETLKTLQKSRQQHVLKLKQTIKRSDDSKKQKLEEQLSSLQAKNQAIPINDEHEIAYLFVQEYYNKHSKCDINKLDATAIFSILSKSTAFPKNINIQAAKVRDEVRNQCTVV